MHHFINNMSFWEGFVKEGAIRIIDMKASALSPGRTHWGLSGPAMPITLQ